MKLFVRFLSSIFICGKNHDEKKHFHQQRQLIEKQKSFVSWFRHDANENHQILEWIQEDLLKRDESLNLQNLIHCLHVMPMIYKTFTVNERTGNIYFFFTFVNPINGESIYESFGVPLSLLDLL
jgi:hypothetical protein